MPIPMSVPIPIHMYVHISAHMPIPTSTLMPIQAKRILLQTAPCPFCQTQEGSSSIFWLWHLRARRTPHLYTCPHTSLHVPHITYFYPDVLTYVCTHLCTHVHVHTGVPCAARVPRVPDRERAVPLPVPSQRHQLQFMHKGRAHEAVVLCGLEHGAGLGPLPCSMRAYGRSDQPGMDGGRTTNVTNSGTSVPDRERAVPLPVPSQRHRL